ncbi:MAG TPA: glycosyltransferase family 39 protein, partial [Chloroflexota bacterium]|nr:glycosyltransferase family 39 protein [Chloroflexota bacterium]
MAIRQLDWLPGTTRRSMLLDGLVIALVAILARGALQYLAPVFINKDSVSYFVPGWDLAHGVGFSPDYRRAPLYSWLIAAALAAFGDQLSSVSLVQHILGAGTVVAAYILGVLTFGRRVALISALIAAVSGPLLIYEQRIDAETLFGFLLTITALFWALGLRRSQHRWFFVGGLVLGLAALTRPAGQVLILALPVALLIQKRQIGGAIGPACAAVVGLLLSKLPWTLLLYLQTGLVSGGATLGEPLLSHLVFGQQWMASAYRGEQLASEFRADGWLYDPLTTAQIRFALPDERANLSSDELLNQGRRQSIRLLSQGQSPSATRERIERSLQISPAQIDAVFQNLALEMIRSQPLGFLASSLRGSALVMLGRVEHLEISWDARRSQAGRMMEDDWYEVRRIRDLVQPATPTQMSAYGFIDALTNLVQPSRYGGIMSMLALLSVFVCRGRMDWGIATLLWSSVVILTLTSTTFSWAAPRYRYPIDPLMYLLSVATG